MRNLLEIVNKIAKECGYYTVEGLNVNRDSYVGQIIGYINDGYNLCWEKIFNDDGWQEIGSYELDADQPTQETNITSFDSLTIHGHELKLIPIKEYNRLIESHDAVPTGKPQVASLWKGILSFYPQPDKAYTLNYKGHIEFQELESEDDTPLIDDSLLIAYGVFALRSFHNQMTDLGLYQVFETLLAVHMNSLVNPRTHQIELPKIGVEL
jgi:hypothetical protein